MKLFFRILIFICLALNLLFNIANATDVSIKTEDKGTFLRVYFYNNEDLFFIDKPNKNDINIYFDKKINFKTDEFDPASNRYIKILRVLPDSKSLSIKLSNRNSSYRKFLSENYSGIDINLGDDFDFISKNPPVKLIYSKPPEPRKITKKVNKKVFKKIDKKIVKKTTTKKLKKGEVDKLDLTRKFDLTSLDTELEIGGEKESKKNETKTGENSQSYKQILEPKVDLLSNDLQVKIQLPNISINEENSSADNLKIKFQWDKPNVGAAFFKRGGYHWIIFDSFVNTDKLVSLKNEGSIITDLTQLKNLDNTIVKLKLKDDYNISSAKEDNDWVLSFIKEDSKIENIPDLVLKDSSLTGSKVLLSYKDKTPSPIRFIDPVIGDEIIAIAYVKNSTAFKRKRKYTDFNFLSTYQGVVVSLTSDNVLIEFRNDNIEFTGPTNKLAGGAQAKLRELKEKERKEKERVATIRGKDVTLLKFNSWKFGEDSKFRENEKRLLQEVIKYDLEERGKARLNLARFYFAHRLYPESLSVIKVIKKDDPDLYNSNDVSILQTASQYYYNKFNEALKVIDKVDLSKLNNDEFIEVDFLRKAIILKIRYNLFEGIEDFELEQSRNNNVYDYMSKASNTNNISSNNSDSNTNFSSLKIFKTSGATLDKLSLLNNINAFLKYYPDEIFNEFAILALEERIKRNDLITSELIVSNLRKEERPYWQNSIKFLTGLLNSKQRNDPQALAIWEDVAEDVFDRHNRARVKLALIRHKLKRKEIDEKQAIESLNAIKMLWRGDFFEFNLLKYLGDLYFNQAMYMKGFNAWKSAINLFPGNNESLLLSKKMTDRLVKIFNSNDIEQISNIDAINLYYEFEALTPIGKPGDDMITALIKRLENLDLLEDASALLAHQVKYRFQDKKREKAAIKLAEIYLINKKPEKALEALNSSGNFDDSAKNIKKKKLLRAKILTKLDKNNKVLKLLRGDYSKEAGFARSEVFWKNKVWKKVVEELEPHFRSIKREERKLFDNEIVYLLKLALSYDQINRKRRLVVLYDDFKSLLPESELAEVFKFLTTNRDEIDYKNLEKTVGLEDMKDFLKEYLGSVNKL